MRKNLKHKLIRFVIALNLIRLVIYIYIRKDKPALVISVGETIRLSCKGFCI